jgi:putative transposase
VGRGFSPSISETGAVTCFNPVKHGWVKQVKSWPFSTFHRDVRNGLYLLDWAGDTAEMVAGERI